MNNKLKEKTLYLALLLLTISVVFTFIGHVKKLQGSVGPIDYIAYHEVCWSILRGVNPYDVVNYRLLPVNNPSIVLPSYIVLYWPFILMGISISKYIYLVLNYVVGIIPFIFLLKKTGMLNSFSLKPLNLHSFFAIASVLLYVNSGPFKQCLSNGQTPNIIFCFVIFSLHAKKTWLKSLLLALAALLKYSLFPLFGLIILSKKKFSYAFSSLAIFFIIALTPVFFGHNLVELYTNYFGALTSSLADKHGVNSYSFHGSDMTQFEFFKIAWLNLIGKLIALCLFFTVLIHNRKKEKIGLNLLLVMSAVSMCIVYNRQYNL
ncbi:MAG: DUF2029 domain-containing protein, partial [Lentisphaeraceae bacterium]|nr:DUF2029 domain-containing protein [Lentisphaeraceae bacterium]